METDDAARATEALIHTYSKLVFHVIYGLTGHWQESEDLTQETFLLAFRGIEAARVASGDRFQEKAWLLKIAVNTVRMAQRRQQKLRFISFADMQPKQRSVEYATDALSAEEEIAEANDLETIVAERDVVQCCLQQLPGALRTPLLLSIVTGFSSGEIAHLLDMKEAAVRQRLSRARKTFQHLYAQATGEHLSRREVAMSSQRRVSWLRDHQMHQPAALVSVAL